MSVDTIRATPRRNQSPKSSIRRTKIFTTRRRVFGVPARGRMMRAAQALRASGRLTLAQCAVLEALLYRILGNDGACFPSYAYIAARAAVARSSAQLAVIALERVGLLEVCNRLRWERVHVEGVGWSRRPRQTSNCYVFVLPDVASSEAKASARPAPAAAAALDASSVVADAVSAATATPVAGASSSSTGGPSARRSEPIGASALDLALARFAAARSSRGA